MARSKKRPVPLAPPALTMKSRKKARKVTTMFHKYTRDRDLALEKGDMEGVHKCDKLLTEMGGREEYQRASQLSTSFHSTSKWVLGSLARRGWLYGIPLLPAIESFQQTQKQSEKTNTKPKARRKRLRRSTRLLEVGAINTELLDAGGMSPGENDDAEDNDNNNNNKIPEENGTSSDGKHRRNQQQTRNSYKLEVRALDIHSMDERIEEADFLTIPFVSADICERYDVIVCSMVLNCVTTPVKRGKMVAKLYHHLRPGGLLFLTIPKFCLTKSAFLSPPLFQKLLSEDGVGFRVQETKESPKIAFFICQRPEKIERSTGLNPIWTREQIRNKGKKFPNQFSVVLEEEEVFDRPSSPIKSS